MKMTESGRTTRSATNDKFKLNNTPHICIGDATRMWNEAPPSITNTKSILTAKKEIKSFRKNLPIQKI